MSQGSRTLVSISASLGLLLGASAIASVSAQDLKWQGVDPKEAPCPTVPPGPAVDIYSGQSGGSASMPSCDGTFRLPVVIAPSQPESVKPYTPGAKVVPDYRVASTELGFEKGVAPAPGRTVIYRGGNYFVAEVLVAGGGPIFSGNSRHVISTSGANLMVGLKEIGEDKDERGGKRTGAKSAGAPVVARPPIDLGTARPMDPLTTGAPI